MRGFLYALRAIFLLAGIFGLIVNAGGVAWAGDVHHLSTTPTVLDSRTISGTPVDVTSDDAGHIIVVTQERELFSLAADGSVLDSEPLPAGGGTPVAVTMNLDGDVYVLEDDRTVHRVNALSLDTPHSVPLGGAGRGVDIHVGSAGDIVYIATSSGTIHRRAAGLGELPPDTGTVPGTPTAIFADDTGEIYVTSDNATGDNVYRLSASLDVLSQGHVDGAPLDVAANESGTVIVASSGARLTSITPTITELASRTLSGALAAIDLNKAGDVVAVNTACEVFVVNTGLSSHSSVTIPDGTACRAITIRPDGDDIYVVGGTGAAGPEIVVAPLSLEFDATAIGTAVGDLPILSIDVTGVSGGPLTVEAESSNASTFEVLTAPFTLNDGDTAPIQIRFNAPAPADDYAEMITVTASADGMSDTETVEVSGESFAPIPEACISTGRLDFDLVNTGEFRELTFRVTNCGSDELVIYEVTLSSTDPGGVWVGPTPGVPPVIRLPAVLDSGDPDEFHEFTLRLEVPAGLTEDIRYNATIRVTTNDPDPVATIDAMGTGHLPVPKMRVTSTVLDYHQVEFGFAFTKPVLIYNDGDADLTVNLDLHPTVSDADPVLQHWGPPSGSLDLRSVTIPPSVPMATGEPEVFLQVYEPKDPGDHEVLLEVTSNDPDPATTTREITLHGEGVAPIPMDVALVLDRSDSMSETAGTVRKIDAMRTASDLFAHLLSQRNLGDMPFGDQLALVKYNHTSSVYLLLDVVGGSHLSEIENDRLHLDAISDSARLEPDGLTAIGAAMITAAELVEASPPERKHIMVLLTDGHENIFTPPISEALEEITAADSDLKIYSVGLGEDHDPDKLREISNVTNGYYQVQEDLSDETIFDLEAFYFKIFVNAAEMMLVVDPTHVIRLDDLGPQIVDSATISSSDRSAFFVALELPQLRVFYDLELVDPHGNVIVPGSTVGGIPVHQMTRENYRIFRIIFPDRSLADSYVGDWLLRMTPNGKWSEEAVKQVLDKNDLFNGGGWINPSAGMAPIGFGAAVRSNYRMEVAVLNDSYLPGANVTLTSTLTDRGWPAPNGRVDVTITTPDGTEYPSMTMYDDGTHGDAIESDAVFTRLFLHTSLTGSYRFFFHGIGRNERGELNPREDTRYLTLAQPTPDHDGPIDPDEGVCIPCWLLRLLWVFTVLSLLLLLLCCWRKWSSAVTHVPSG